MVKEVNMDTSSTIKRLLGEYEKIRTENQREGQRREREIRQGFPAIAALLDERRDRLTGSIRTALQGRAVDAENAGEHKGGLGRHSFAQFDLNVFPDVPIPGEKRSQRDHMRLILRAAQRYAEDFPDNEKPNLIFFGAAGLGKTFVADCIAQRIMERAYLVRRVTAYRLCEIMRKNQFDGSEARAVEGVMDCDLLFQVINERNMNDRHTIISTNLNPERMEGMYEQRVASRLMDVSRTTAIRFYGEDLRLRK